MKVMADIQTDGVTFTGVIIEPREFPPEDPREGRVFYCTLDNETYIWNGTKWENLTESDAIVKIYATGPIKIDDKNPNQPSISISLATPEMEGLMSKEDKKKLDDATSDLAPKQLVKRDAIGNFEVEHPIKGNHVATKTYVDSIMYAYSQIKPPVRLALENNVELFGLRNIDGVQLETGDRILLISQDKPIENGIYIAAKGTWKRSIDVLGYATIVFIEEGKYADKAFFLKGGKRQVGKDDLQFEILRMFENDIRSNDTFVGCQEPPKGLITVDDVWIEPVVCEIPK